MNPLSKTNMSIATILPLMERQEPEAIQLNHMVIEDNSMNVPVNLPATHLPSFTVQFAGFVEVEFFMDTKHERVRRLTIQQSAMTFEDLERNGDVLPALSVACATLSDDQRDRLDAIAKNFIAKGKLTDPVRAEALLSQYVEKAMFCTRRFGPLHMV